MPLGWRRWGVRLSLRWGGGVSNGPICHRPFGRHPTSLYGGAAGGCNGWSGLSTPVPCPIRACGKGRLSLPATPTFRMRGGRIYQPSSHIGCGCAWEGQDGGASHPKLGPGVGPAVFPESLWSEDTLQRLPPTARLCPQHFSHEPVPGPRVRWWGVHAMAY